MDRSELAKLMLRWEQAKRLCDELEAAIRDAVLQLGETQAVGNVVAQYSGGRRRFDYEAVCRDAPPEIVDKYTQVVRKVDFRGLALEGLGIPKADIPHTQSPPSVTLKLRN